MAAPDDKKLPPILLAELDEIRRQKGEYLERQIEMIKDVMLKVFNSGVDRMPPYWIASSDGLSNVTVTGGDEYEYVEDIEMSLVRAQITLDFGDDYLWCDKWSQGASTVPMKYAHHYIEDLLYELKRTRDEARGPAQ